MSVKGDKGDKGEVEWVMIGLDPKMAKRQGLPAQIPLPKTEFEGLADKGLSVETARTWVKDFLTTSPMGQDGTWRRRNSGIVNAFDAFLDNAVLWDKAQKAFAENDFPKAISTLKRITIMNADDHAAKLNLACAYANSGDHAAALKVFKEIRPTFEGEPEYHVNVAQLHLALKDRDKALDELVLALEAKPDHQPALDAMVQLGVIRPIYENPRDAASLTYVRADSIAEYLTGVWDAEPRDPDFFLEQLAYHEREARYDVALAAADRALKAGAEGSKAERAELARVSSLRSMGRKEEALAAAEAYAQRAPTSAGAQVELAKSLDALGRGDEARAAVKRALELDPGDLQALMYRFWPADMNDIKAIGESAPALREFAEAHPGSAGAWRTLARAYIALGRLDEAIELFARAVGLTPADDELRAEYWKELGKQQRYKEILADAAKIEDMVSRDWTLRWQEAEAYAGLGKRMEARGAFTAINHDEKLHVDIRKRAKRAVKSMDEAPPDAEAPAEPSA